MIYTITLNPAIDKIMMYDNFRINKTNRAFKESRYAAGKGIHTSKLLSNMSIPNLAIYISGPKDKWYKQDLERQKIDSKAFYTELGQIRENLKLIDKKSQTECNGISMEVSPKILNDIFIYLSKRLNKNDFIIMSGSIPTSINLDTIDNFLTKIKKISKNLILDISNINILIKLLKFKPLLIKPNVEEYRAIKKLGISPYDILKMGAQNIFHSQGAKGGVLINKDQITNIRLNKKFKIVNLAGAGDSFIGGFVMNYKKSKDPLLASQYGVICGTATSISERIANKETITKVIKELNWNQF